MSDEYSHLFHSHSISILNDVWLSHTLQHFSSSSLYTGSLKCNSLFRTPPCCIDLSHVVEFLSCMFKRHCPSVNVLKIFLAHPYNYEIFLQEFQVATALLVAGSTLTF